MGRAHSDSRGRPVVVVTGVGVLTSLGAGKQDNWRELTSRALRHPAHQPLSRLADCAPTSPARSTSCRSTRCRRRPCPSASPNWSSTRRWPRQASAPRATSRDRCSWRCRRWRLEWTQRLARRRGVGANETVGYDDLLRAAAMREVRPLLRAVPVRLGWPRTWRCASAPKARRWRPPPHAHLVRPRSSSASRRSGAARPRRRW